ncbi:MAG: recombinase family protein [Patescibacteria group bacterium]
MSRDQKEQKIEYFLYARKSSESEDRQIQSIDDQESNLRRLASNLGIKIKEVLTESKSAKKPYCRPVFASMLERIEKGEAQGILCWQINRLSRNPVDSGTLGWMLQQGALKCIRTIDRQYLPDDNVLLFSIETGQANQFIIDLKKNSMRGMIGKVERGWLPSRAPIGYLNDTIKKVIIKDPERFNIVRKMWDMMLTGHYTPPKVLHIANNEWGLRTVKYKREGGKELSTSGIYRMFTNVFYMGIVDWGGQRREGKHDHMITPAEYDRVQLILGRAGKPRPKTHSFAFTGAIRCDSCGCLYTAETKQRLLISGKVNEHTYYHCTRKTRKIICDQKKHIPVENLELAIEKEIEKYTILPEFLEWALEGLDKNNATEIEDEVRIREMKQKNLLEAEKELDELTKMRRRQLIDDDSFIKGKQELQPKIDQMKAALQETETQSEKWIELTQKTFNFATYARKAFITAEDKEGLERQKEILLGLGERPVIKGEKLIIEPYEWLIPIKKEYPALEREYRRLERRKMLTPQTKTEALASVHARWGGYRDSNPD